MGLEIYLNTDTPTQEALAFYRAARPKEGEVYVCDRKTTKEGKRDTTLWTSASPRSESATTVNRYWPGTRRRGPGGAWGW